MGDDMKAIECYTISLAYSNSNELIAYAHANRSAALYRKQLYKECLIDIDAALWFGYPKEKQRRLKERSDKAIMEIKKLLHMNMEDINIQSVMDKLCLHDNNEKCITKTEDVGYIKNKATIEEEFEMNNQRKRDVTNNENYPYYTKISVQKPRYLQNNEFLKLKYGSNKEVPSVSDGAIISFSERYGRHYIATKDFKPGDIISIEDPYAHVIYEEQ